MLFFNVAKCKCLFLTNKHIISFPRIQLDNQTIKFIQSYKYLGVTITSNLSWSQHIQVICKETRSVPLGGYALTVDPTERTEPAKESGSSSICLALAGLVAEAQRLLPSSLEFEF